jgi:hypothetical protein
MVALQGDPSLKWAYLICLLQVLYLLHITVGPQTVLTGPLPLSGYSKFEADFNVEAFGGTRESIY